MVKITLEYGSVEEAIQALGKLSGLAKVRRAAAATTTGAPVEQPQAADTAAVAAQQPAAPTKRKGRSDKGKPRGPHKEVAAGVSGGTPVSSPDQVPVADLPAPLVPAEVAPQEPAAASPSEADAKAALEAYFDRHGPQKAMALLAGFGVSKLRELPEGERAAFIAKCGE